METVTESGSTGAGASAAAIEIRGIEERDLPAAAELSGQLGYPSRAEEMPERLERLKRWGHEVFVAADARDRVIGWIHVFIHPSLAGPTRAELGGFVVDEACRGQGVGRRLLARAEEWSRGQRAGGVRFSSRKVRVEAHEFYKRMGYSVIKESLYFEKKF